MTLKRLMVGGCLLWLSISPVFANLPIAWGLDVPTVTNDTLHPVDKAKFAHVTSRFHVTLPMEVSAAVYCMPSMPGGRASAVFVSKRPDGRFAVIEYSISFSASIDDELETPKTAEFILETQLAERLIALIKFELKRTSAKTKNEYIVMNGTTYYFHIPSASKSDLFGTTDGGYPNATIQRLCQAVDMLGGLPTINESDRVQLIGEIDRAITAIEVAYKLTR